ncbi:eukaryotic translation initiation factor 5B [Parasteatoda tepidariorum]|uniref:eukaryotic translation initiation factor 5B n=1 Tax=Parasteatoda tepidariorum TaxID=114398 RepID=UPI001C7198F4|nr:eukaryotic translation initiation factor 5B-like [Parasteatoda tepidariorum]XP_042902234.1 eukaryotic translation initiation factor 5B-like [Parasteatoda tepidariorum]XP_042902236.1 eukaryotic translation initiation factor 5B-like [Parasteatoda tepidariorum]XP_042902237.1 eukaryotic translation initiation factor 5B-like [Parasteatoda tepidariorum]
MGRNRKVKQYATQSSQSDSEENGNHCPVEFLTSDDFKVVLPKRHNKRSPDAPEDFPYTSRSRNNSCRISVCSEEADVGCYSSFWMSKSHSIDKPANGSSTDCKDTTSEDDKEESILALIAGLEVETAEPDADCDNESEDEKLLNEIANATSSDCSETRECEINCDKNLSACDGSSDKRVLLQENKHSVNGTIDNCNPDCLVDTRNVPEVLDLKIKFSDEPNAESSSPSNVDNVTKSKSHKKKKRPKNKANKEATDEVGRSRQNTTPSSENSPTECPAVPSFDTGDSSKQDRKKLSKKRLAAIHEALRKAKEEEEKWKREEEAKRKEAEEAEKRRQEIARLEQEKKEKKKLKEKARKERLKSEGRLLSKSQKQARARMQATIEIYRQQGVDIPQIGERPEKSVRVGSYKSTVRRRFDSTQSDRSEVSRNKTESFSSQESKESFSDIPNSFESKESLDFISIGSLATESDTGHYSFSEDSDALDDDNLPSEKSLESEAKESAAKPTQTDVKTTSLISETVMEDKESESRLRSPVICVLGHVDTGKTKLLDYIRKTHIQDSEAGGITQQIGATMIPRNALKEKCKMVKDFDTFNVEVPGLLVIDTPGHESFRNLRSRGTSLCDIAVLVVDIMHGLQAQTLESLNLLKASKTPFIVALNKLDRIYGWKSIENADIVEVIQSQSENTLWEFKKRCQDIVLQFAKECLNAALYYENSNPRTFVSMVPISAVTGDGMGNILSLLTQLTQSMMYKQLIYSDELKATVLEVKVTPGLGTTIDVILVNGQLREGDTIVLAGQDGPFVTQIRSLLMPHPLKELRVKNPYIDYKTVEGAQGVKISGKDLDKTLAGMPLYVVQNPSKMEALKNEMSQLISLAVNHIKTSERGVYVQASTLGSLEALLDYLSESGIPYFGVKVGPVVKKDVMKASIMLEHDSQYATILAFDVKVDKDAQELADHLGVKILHADIIYHLFDMFVEHRENHLKKLDEKRHLAVFPCILTLLAKITADCSSPLVLHVTVEAGVLRNGTPLCVPKRSNLDIGTVTLIQVDGQTVLCAKEGQSALVTVDSDLHQPLELEPDDNLVSRISRQSIDVLKEYYKDELSPSDWHLMSELKKVLNTT